MFSKFRLGFFALLLVGCQSTVRVAPAPDYDLIIRHGMVYDGSGNAGRLVDVGVRGDRIIAIADLHEATARREVDALGLAVAPGFVNMLSWAVDTLIVDGRSLSDLEQGVTLEVFGEGWSYGPLSDAMKADMKKQQTDITYDISWTTLGEYLDFLQHKGVSTNVASFVGATTVRQNVLGDANRAPSADELLRMQKLVREAMQQGALGVGSALIYAPGTYATTAELTALATTAAASGGGYISHMRSEGDRLLEGIDELIGIARASGGHAEIYHMKAAGRDNWPKMQQAIARVAAARAQGVSVSANMYSYTAGGTGLNACMDTALQEGGLDAWIERLKQPKIRAQVVAEMRRPGSGWENICYASGGPEHILLNGFNDEKFKPLVGKTLAQVAALRGTSPEDAAVDLIIEDHSRIDTIFFIMSEDNVKLGLSQAWVSLGSDEGSYAPVGVLGKLQPHPRAYGNFARFLGRYVRDEHVTTLADAIRRLSALPAENFKLADRGHLAPGYFADIVVFDPSKIIDHASYEKPQQFATGIRDVFVNGEQVIANGKHTGAMPGRFVHGPGYIAPATH